VKADQSKRVYVGYYPSWSDNWFQATDWTGTKPKTPDQILVESKMARIPAVYTHVIVGFAQPDLTWRGSFNADTWEGTGIQFNGKPQDIKASVNVLHQRNMKVLVAVGGASYNNWGALAAENGNPNGPITKALAQMLIDVGFDGLDVDYEVSGVDAASISTYTGAINAMRKAVDLAKASTGRTDLMLTLAAWSTGADPVGTYWSGNAGRERLVFDQKPALAAKIDMVSVMTYDAQYLHYDGVYAWQRYRALFPTTTIVNIGFETAPEGWAGGMLVVEDADAQCTGSTILQDQMNNTVNKPYSVHRYASAVKQANVNPRDGAMLWTVLKTGTAACGSATVASPGTISNKLHLLYGLPADPRISWK